MYSYHDIGKGINIWTILVVFQLATHSSHSVLFQYSVRDKDKMILCQLVSIAGKQLLLGNLCAYCYGCGM